MQTCFTQWKVFVALTGEEAAHETLIRRFEHRVFNLVSRLMDDPSDVADVVEKVFRKVFRNVGIFRGEGTLKISIYRIAVSEAHNRRRWLGRHRRQRVRPDGEPGEPFGYEDSLPDIERSPFGALVGQETHALIEEALKAMNPKLRAALVLREIEALSYEEISEILDVSPETVKSRIVGGRDALRKHLARDLNRSSAPGWSAQSED